MNKHTFAAKTIVAAMVALFLGVIVSSAQAQQPSCGERAQFVNNLEEQFAKYPVAMGLTDKGAVIEVFASENGSWTFLLTMPSGLTCIVAMGKSWENLSALTQLGWIS